MKFAKRARKDAKSGIRHKKLDESWKRTKRTDFLGRRGKR